MEKVRFGLNVNVSDWSSAPDLYRFADESGFPMFWISDSQSVFRDLYVQATVAAIYTKRIVINPGPTNPVTRHPAVTASAISSVDELSGGRAALTISSGDSAVLNLDLKPAKIDALREYILAMKALWRDHETTYQGRTIRLLWNKREIPVYITAEGPRSLRLAGEIADGVLIGMGFTPEAINGALQYLREGAESAGRRLEDIDIWWQTRWNIDDDREKAIEEIRMGMATGANHAFRFTFEGKFLPTELEEPIKRLQAAYKSHEMGNLDAPVASLVDELGLRDYLLERFVIAGTRQDFIKRVEDLAAQGVTQIRLAMSGKDRARLLNIVTREIMPHFE